MELNEINTGVSYIIISIIFLIFSLIIKSYTNQESEQHKEKQIKLLGNKLTKNKSLKIG